MSSTVGNPCVIDAGTVKNTGVECSASLGVAKGLYLVEAAMKWTSADEADPGEWFKNMIHQRKIFPVLQGIFDFGTTAESDVSETNAITGTVRKLRSGGITMLYTFEDGGLCLAKALKTFEGKGYRVMLVDQDNKVQRRKNADGTFSGLKSNDIASAIIFATASASFKNTISISVSQDELIKYGDLIVIKNGDITDNNGLIDTEIYKAADTPTPTAGTGAARTITISALGTNGDTINLKDGSGVSLTGAVTQTSSESTPTILATKIKNAGNAATSTNGGYTYTSTGAVITEIAPASLGATVNGSNVVPTVVGSISTSQTIFAGGVSQSGKIIIGVRTECAKTDLVAEYGADLADPDLYVVTDNIAPTVPITMTAALNAGKVELSGRLVSGHTYTAIGSAPTVWLSKDIEGYDASVEGAEFLIP